MTEKGSFRFNLLDHTRKLIQERKRDNTRKRAIMAQTVTVGVCFNEARGKVELTEAERRALEMRLRSERKRKIAKVDSKALGRAWGKLLETDVGPRLEQAIIDLTDLIDAREAMKDVAKHGAIPWKQISNASFENSFRE